MGNHNATFSSDYKPIKNSDKTNSIFDDPSDLDETKSIMDQLSDVSSHSFFIQGSDSTLLQGKIENDDIESISTTSHSKNIIYPKQDFFLTRF